MRGPKIFVVDRESKADYTVCFVKSRFREKNADIIKNGEITQNEYRADITVYITDRESRADILITYDNFPK